MKIKTFRTKEQKKHKHIYYGGWMISIYENGSKYQITAYPIILMKNGGTKSHHAKLREYLTKASIREIIESGLYLTPNATYVKLDKRSSYSENEIDMVVSALKHKLPLENIEPVDFN